MTTAVEHEFARQQEDARQSSLRVRPSRLTQHVTIEQVSEAYQVSEGTVRKLISDKKLPAYSFNGGRSLRLRVDEVERVFGQKVK